MALQTPKILAFALAGQFVFIGAQVASADTQRVVPNQLTINLGKQLSGTVQSLWAVDMNALSIRQFIVPNRQSDVVRFTVLGQTHNLEPTALSFVTLAEASDPGVYNQLIDLYDFSTGSWVRVYDSPMSTTWLPAEGVGTGILRRFVGPNGAVMTRVGVAQRGPGTIQAPAFAWDMGNWVIVQ